jgi:anti-anti-sigma factor
MSDAPAATPIAIERNGNALVVRVQGKLLAEADYRHLRQLIDQSADPGLGVTVVALDLSRLQLLPSLGLGALVQIRNKCESRQQKLRLAAVPAPIRDVLSVTKLDRLFEITESVEAALE